MIKEQQPSLGVQRYALGMGFLISPKTLSKRYTPELLDNSETQEEQALTIITQSAKLAVYGLIDVLDTTRTKLGLNNISELRPASLRSLVNEEIESDFNSLYSCLEAGGIDSLSILPEVIIAARYNPLRAPGTFMAMTHHKNKLTISDLSGPLPVPGWICKTGLLEKPFGDLNIGLTKKARNI